MRLRNSLLALLLLAGLSAWIYFYEYRGEEGRKEAEQAEKKVFNFETDKAVGLDLVRPDGTLSLRKEGPDWKITAPVQARADADEVSGLLSTLSWLEVDRKLEAPPDSLEGFKLKEPPLRIVLHPEEGKPEIALAVGDKAPIGSAYYARRGDAGDVITVSASVDRLMEATVEKLRYKKVVGVDSWKVARFTMVRGGTMTGFAKSGEDWRIESPISFPADRGKVSNLLYDLTSLAAEGFEPEGTAPEAAGLSRPEATLRIEEKEGKSVTVEFSAKDASGVVRARRADIPEIFKVKGEFLDKLAVDAKDYRDARVAPVDRWEVSEIRLKAPDGERIVVKDAESNWRWGAADGPALEQKLVDDLMDALEETRAVSWSEGVGTEAAGAAAPLVLSVKAGDAPPVEVRVGGEREGKVLVTSSAAPAVYEVEKQAADKLTAAASALRPPEAAAASAGGDAGGTPGTSGGGTR